MANHCQRINQDNISLSNSTLKVNHIHICVIIVYLTPREKITIALVLNANLETVISLKVLCRTICTSMSMKVTFYYSQFQLETFPLTRIGLPIVLIGGGIGLTPLMSMLNYLVEEETHRSNHLYSCNPEQYNPHNETTHCL